MKRYIPLSLAVAAAGAVAQQPPMEHVLVSVPLHQQAAETALPVTVLSGDASGPSADHAVSVEPLLAEGIEIMRGPSTLLYGGGAIGGVINVLDNRIPDSVPQQTTGGIEYRYVSASDLSGGVFKLDGGSGNWAYHLDGLYRDWDDLDIRQTRYDATQQLERPVQPLETVRSYLTYTDYGHKEIESSGEVGTRYRRDGWAGAISLRARPDG